MLDLDRVARNPKAQLGELKMTVAQFFRINGGTTQLRGVTPDIPFPAFADPADSGESSFDNALPWVQIKPADYSPAGNLQGLLPILSALHETRVKQDKGFQYLQEDIAELKQQREKKTLSLNEAERRAERDTREAREKAREAATASAAGTPKKRSGRQDDGLQPGERNLTDELAAEKARKSEKDILLDEAVHIVSDAAGVLKSNSLLADQVSPRARVMAN